jgi:hypothetical protein
MNLSLDQAIEIHGQALKRRSGARAPGLARERARRCKAAGDDEGYTVWTRVAESASSLLAADAMGGKPARPRYPNG